MTEKIHPPYQRHIRMWPQLHHGASETEEEGWIGVAYIEEKHFCCLNATAAGHDTKEEAIACIRFKNTTMKERMDWKYDDEIVRNGEHPEQKGN